MDLHLHLCGPKGDGQRLLLDRALALVQADNEFLFQAMLRSGMAIPEKVEDLGIPYRDDTLIDPNGGSQHYFGYRQLLEHGSWSCGDAAALEAAALVVKYGLPATAFSDPRGDGIFHALYRTSAGIVDPVARYHAAHRGGMAV
jgi:hypothetical protein